MLTLNIIMWRIRKLFRWRPELWKEFKFVKFLWETTREDYGDLKDSEKQFMALISKGNYDEATMKKLERLYVILRGAWIGIRGNKWWFEELKHKSLRLNFIESKIYYGYRDAAYEVFYRCSEHLMDARIKMGRADPSKKEPFLKEIAYYRDNKYPA